MEDTREHKTTTGELAGDERRAFMRALLSDLRALERMLAEGMFEKGVAASAPSRRCSSSTARSTRRRPR